jgi:hypothetical protein
MAMEFEYNNENAGIYASTGIITVMDKKQNVQTIYELPMVEYENFYRNWILAMQVGSDDDFVNNYIYNTQFRNLMDTACDIVGIDPNYLTPEQMQILFLSTEDKDGNIIPGVIFGLHSTYPKFPTSKMDQIPSTVETIHLVSLTTLTILMLREYLPTMNWMVKPLAKISLCLGLLLNWLIDVMSRFYKIQTSSKRLSTINGEMK